MTSRIARRIVVVWTVVFVLPLGLTMSLQADQVITDDLIVQFSACIGNDCVNGESFGFDTIRLKENNVRIKFQDTSNSASFPTNDWQLTANDSANGGANKFSIDDIDGGRTPFTIEAGAPSHSLYVEDGGRVGFGTNTPVVELHVKDGDTPTLRLEQDGSSGFQAQTWDLAGNETNFFVRDVTNGSTLPFRIRPNAPTSSIDIEGATGDVGIGTTSPEAPIHIFRSDGTAKFLVEEASGTNQLRNMFNLRNRNGGVQFRMEKDTATATDVWLLRNDQDDSFKLLSGLDGNAPAQRLTLNQSGDLFVTGNIDSGGTTTVPDYVFESDYKLTPLPELADFIAVNKHLPNIPSAAEVKAAGKVSLTKMQMKLLEKIEELTLYTIDQQKTIDELKTRLEKVENTKAKLE